MNKQILRIIILLLITLSLGFYAMGKGLVLGTKANVVGNLKFTYPGGVTPETLFNELDFKPGDCKEAIVKVENLGSGNSIVGVFSDGEFESDGLSGNLMIEITVGTNTLYDPLLLSQFFTDSDVVNEIELLTLAGNATVNLHFKICFPETDANGLQGDKVVFDLEFGQIKKPIELPEVCKDLEGIVTVVIDGTPGDDELDGTGASELIRGFEGNDEIDGNGGDDCIIGGPGEEDIDGGSGNDIIDGGSEHDDIDAGSGNDYVAAGEGNDKVDGGSGLDEIYGQGGNDHIKGGSENDYIEGGLGNDKIEGGSGLDQLLGQEGNDDIRGGSGDDLLNGGPNHDVLKGDSGTDTCTLGESYSSCEL